MATSLPKTAPKLLSLPASWAEETHFQSRYPAGFSLTHGAASSSAFPEAGAIEAATPIIAASETRRKAILLIVAPFECEFYTLSVACDRNAYLSDDPPPVRRQCKCRSLIPFVARPRSGRQGDSR